MFAFARHCYILSKATKRGAGKPVSILILLSVILLFILSPFCAAQNGSIVTDEWLKQNYTKREVLVEVRDGARIYAAVFEPVGEYLESLGRSCSPVMVTMTPYSLKSYGLSDGEISTPFSHSGYLSSLKGDMANYVADGYIIVYLNTRGKFLSEGEYVNMRPYVSGTDGAVDTVKIAGKVQTDDATDIYDVVEWVLGNTRNNGKVGVKGVSYPGFYTVMAILSRHPAIKAASPQAPATDWFMGDDAHHNGAFCLTDMYRFGSGFFRNRKYPSPKGMSSLFSTKQDIYEYFRGKPFSDLSSFFGDSLSFWNDMMSHPDYDEFWQVRNPSQYLSEISIPVLVTGGFYDAEDCYGALHTYNMLKKLSPHCELYLAAGPWYHGGWNNRTANHIGDTWFGNSSGAYYQDKVEYPFFSYYLEDRQSADTQNSGKSAVSRKVCKPEYVNVLASRETSRQQMENIESDTLWETYGEWPPKAMRYEKMFLSGKDSLRIGGKGTNPDRYTNVIVSDPESPVPYMNVKSSSRDRAYMTADQRFASSRSDVLTFSGKTVNRGIHLAGPVKVHLVLSLDEVSRESVIECTEAGIKSASSDNAKCSNGVSASKKSRCLNESAISSNESECLKEADKSKCRRKNLDADIVVKLIDVRPDGYHMLIRGDVMPLRFREGFQKPLPTRAGETVKLDFTLCDVDHYIEPGHSLMVQIQGSWFPLIAMNPQTFLPNPYKAVPDDYIPVQISVYSRKSYLELPIM